MCFKELMISHCKINKAEVEKNHHFIFQYWNWLNGQGFQFRGKCHGDKDNSKKICKLDKPISDFEKQTIKCTLKLNKTQQNQIDTCGEKLANKIGLTDPKVSKYGCFRRMTLYICFKDSMTPFCNINKQ